INMLLKICEKTGTMVINNALKYSEDIMNSVLYTLTDREQKVIKLRVGVNDTEERTIEEVAIILNLTCEQVSEVEAKAFRKLRHPSRLRELTGRNIYEFLLNNYDDFYSLRLSDLLTEEIASLVENKQKRSFYIEKIMKRYEVSITNQKDLKKNIDYDLDELELSVRTYNCLKRAGINTFSELAQMSDSELKHIIMSAGAPEHDRKWERICYAEVKRKMKELAGISEDGCNTIVLTYNGDKTVYKYFDVDTQKIAKSIYINLINMRPGAKIILKAPLSPGVQDILLMKGYLYIEDVYNDSEQLIKQLQAFGFEDFAQEIWYLKKMQEKPNEDEKVYIYPMDDEVMEFIQNKECSSACDFIEKAENVENEKIADLAQRLLDAKI
ncbi:MAG: hypothetical protein K2G45_03840, partial [Lachnospiraceae bacterium]|nr:hypothetical protein [Lachnospiraceae bacterium]